MTDFCSMFVSKVSSLLLGPINGLFIPSPENSIVSLLYFVPNSRSNGKMGTANRVHYRGGALQGHDHCTLFVTCCRHPVYSSRTFPSNFLLFVWRQVLKNGLYIICIYDSVQGGYICGKWQKWQIDTVDRLFPCQLYRVTLFLTPMANNDTAL